MVSCRVSAACRSTFNALLQLVNSHLIIAMDLVKQTLVVLMHVDLLLIAATHGGPQLTGEGVLALLQFTQQGWGDGDVVTPAPPPSLGLA